MKSCSEKRIYFIYFILILGACISFVFTNISYDAEYQLAMAYRFIKGDKMIVQMWEPHQTSAFLCAFFMKLYMMVTGTTTGIVLYTQVVGLLVRGGIALWFSKIVKECAGDKPALIAGVIYLLISPKELLTPEFSNMQVWFSTIMFLCLLQYWKKAKWYYLIGAAISLCLGVFSYPSVILCYFAAFYFLWRHSKNRKKDICLFTAVCALIGGMFVAYLLVNIGWETILQCLSCALGLEPSHTVSMSDKFLAHLIDMGKILLMLTGVFIIGLVMERIQWFVFRRKAEKKSRFSLNDWFSSSWFVLMIFLLINILRANNRGGYSFPFVVILAWGVWKRNLLTREEKTLYDFAAAVGTMNLFATLILSDHVFTQAITYMLVWICASVIPIYRWYEKIEKDALNRLFRYGFHVWLLLILFRIAFIHIPINGRGQICSLTDDLGLIRSGPAIGIVTDEIGAAKQRDSMKEWSRFVKPGDTIWILGEPLDTLGYLYEDVNVGAPTVMSTPTYNENLLYYWELNPDKYPDVVILASSFGELTLELSQNQWLMDWLEKEYCADTVTDGYYWRYYERRR